MQRVFMIALVSSAFAAGSAMAGPLSISPEPSDAFVRPFEAQAPNVRYAAGNPNLGGGFIEFLFGGGRPPAPPYAERNRIDPMTRTARGEPVELAEPTRPTMDPRYRRQVVDYGGDEKPGTVIINTPERFLYLVQEGGRAIRYGIGVGRPGFAWAGVKQISSKREWPDWTPPAEMLKRRPDLPRHTTGGPENPLGARAMYLGSSLYRIHGSNEPWTIGTAVSSGCIRMRNEDVIDLYERVQVGTRVIVI